MNRLQIKIENDKLFEQGEYEMCSKYFEYFPLNDSPSPQPLIAAEHTVSRSTIECILENAQRKIIALNFANANYPGGAYVTGGNAQEESLCRSSLWYDTI